MSNKHDKDILRKQKLHERELAKKARTAIVRDGDKRTVIKQGNTKGYDMQMIQDSLDHLLVEVRVQHFENLKAFKALGSTDNRRDAVKALEEPSPKIIEQFMAFQKKYQSALIASNVIDGTSASADETKDVMIVVAKGMLARRDEQFGHLEALKDLFAEVLHCAKLPFGIDQEGNPIQPKIIHKAKDLMDEARISELPAYEDLLPLNRDSPFATAEGIQRLKNHDRSIPIGGVRPDGERLLLYGAEHVEKARKSGQTDIDSISLPVSKYTELQFAIAAIAKFIGAPSTDGRTCSV